MKTMLRLSLGFTLLCAFGSAIVLLAGVKKPVLLSPLRFDPDPFVLPAFLDWHGDHEFEVAVVNDSDKAESIVGAEQFCASACFSGAGLPATIPAKGRGRVILHVKVNAPGPISEKLDFFTSCPSQPRLTMRIEGLIQESATRENQAANP